MPRSMRFCRACGFRLGEGVEEYNETVRFQNAPNTSPAGKSRTAWGVRPWTSPPDHKEFKAIANRIHERTVKSLTTGLGQMKLGKACKRVPRWMVWVIVPIMIASMTGGFISNSGSRNNRGRSSATASAQNSYFGAHYKTSQGGAFVENITPPGSAADKAGLVGGDVITSFDGKPVKSESDLNNLLSETTVGKTVEVVFIRDGERKTAKLTTISESENDRLREAFEGRSEGRGRLGIDDDDTEIVPVPGTNHSGVRLDDITENYPADIAGVREGDIVIQWDATPIRTTEELVTRIHRAVPYSTINLVVIRGSERLEIPVKIGKQ